MPQEIRIMSAQRGFVHYYLLALALLGIVVYHVQNGTYIHPALLGTILSIALIGVVYPNIKRYAKYCTVAPEQIVYHEGLLHKRRKSFFVSSLTDIDVHQNLWQRIIGCGDLVVKSYEGPVVIRNISQPRETAEYVEHLVRPVATRT